MVRLPQGRQQTVDYLNSLRDFEGPLVYAQRRANGTPQLEINPDVPQFPVGTQWALVRRMSIIDVQGRIRPTPLIESIQLRRYDAIATLRVTRPGTSASGSPPVQQMLEFDLDRRHQGALKALSLGDADFQFVHFMSQGGDPFELPSNQGAHAPDPTSARSAALATCYECHTAAGILSVASFNRERFSRQTVQRLQATEPPSQIAPPYTPPSNTQSETEDTVLWKYRQFDWGLLQGLWRRQE
jgi:hypothetical protein